MLVHQGVFPALTHAVAPLPQSLLLLSFTCWILSRKIPGQRDADTFNKDYSNPAQSPEQVLRPKLRGVDLDLEI